MKYKLTFRICGKRWNDSEPASIKQTLGYAHNLCLQAVKDTIPKVHSMEPGSDCNDSSTFFTAVANCKFL